MPLKRKSIKKKSGATRVAKLSLSKRNRNSKNKRSLKRKKQRQRGGSNTNTEVETESFDPAKHINCNSNVSLQFKNHKKGLKFIDTRTFNNKGGFNVTLAKNQYRDGNSGIWKIIKVQDNGSNHPTLRRDCPNEEIKEHHKLVDSYLQYGNRVELINMYNQYNGYLHYGEFTYAGKGKKGLITMQHPFYNKDNNDGWQLAKVLGSKLHYSGRVESDDEICVVCIKGGKPHVVVMTTEPLFERFPLLTLNEIPKDIPKSAVLIINKIHEHHRRPVAESGVQTNNTNFGVAPPLYSSSPQ